MLQYATLAVRLTGKPVISNSPALNVLLTAEPLHEQHCHDMLWV